MCLPNLSRKSPRQTLAMGNRRNNMVYVNDTDNIRHKQKGRQ